MWALWVIPTKTSRLQTIGWEFRITVTTPIDWFFDPIFSSFLDLFGTPQSLNFSSNTDYLTHYTYTSWVITMLVKLQGIGNLIYWNICYILVKLCYSWFRPNFRSIFGSFRPLWTFKATILVKTKYYLHCLTYILRLETIKWSFLASSDLTYWKKGQFCVFDPHVRSIFWPFWPLWDPQNPNLSGNIVYLYCLTYISGL